MPPTGSIAPSDAPELVAPGRSLTEPAVQLVFRQFAAAVDSLLQPAYLGLAAETNLIRAVAARASLRRGEADRQRRGGRRCARSTRGAALRERPGRDRVGARWAAAGTYVGVATDLADFPFMQAMGLSSYPYLGGFAEPEDVPLDYYARVLQGTGLPADGGRGRLDLGVGGRA